MKLSVVLSTQPAQFAAATFKGELQANLHSIAALGYQGVELAVRDPALLNIDELQRVVKESGLQVSAIGTGQAWGEEGLSFTDPDGAVRRCAIERIKSHVPLAAHFEAVLIIGLIRGVVKPGVARGQAMLWLIDALAECAAEARLRGVRLALEPINRDETTLINTVAEGLQLVQMVDAVNFGLLLDTFHMNIEEPDILAGIRAAGERIFHFHVADSNRWYPGAGHLDFGRILEALSSTGYKGWVSGEFLPLPDALTAAAKGIESLTSTRTGETLSYWKHT